MLPKSEPIEIVEWFDTLGEWIYLSFCRWSYP